MDVAEEPVCFDLETAGLEVTRPITQIAAVAVDRSLHELESFEVKIAFAEADAAPAALHRNQYYSNVWNRDAVDLLRVLPGFDSACDVEPVAVT